MATLVGIRDLPTGRQAYVTVRGKFYSHVFPPDTPTTKLKAWRERKRAEVKYGVVVTAGPTLEAVATDYLRTITHMPSAPTQTHYIQQWVRAFGALPMASITSAMIRQQLATWRTSGNVNGGPLSVASLNRMRTALMALYTWKHGKSAVNVVRDVPPYKEQSKHQLRHQPLVTIAKLIRRVRVGSKGRARLHALMWTGWPSALLKSVKATDVNWQTGMVRLAARQKGKGMPAAWVPVVPRGLLALRRLDQLKAWGAFSNSSLHSVLHRAGGNGLPTIRVYDLRHSFATWAAARIKDDRALAELLRTNSIARYTEGSVAERLKTAIAGLL